MRPNSLPNCLLQVAAYGIAIIPFVHAVDTTIYSTVTRYRISVVPQYTTYTDTTYSIITYTAPPSIHTEYVTATEVKRRTTTFYEATKTVTAAASTVYASECSSSALSSAAPSSDIFSSSTTSSSELASSSGFTVPPVNNAVSGSSGISEAVSTTVEVPSSTENASAELTTSAPQVSPELPTTTGEPIVTSEPAQTTPIVNTEEPPATTQSPSGPTRVPSADTPAGTYNAVECYPDNEGTGFPLAPPVTDSVDPSHYDTPAHCIEHCSTANLGGPFRYAGIEPGHCYCSNGLLTAEPTSDCYYECPGDSTKICGGGAPPTRKLRRRTPAIAIIIYELFGWLPPTSAAVTEVIPTETQGGTTTGNVFTEVPGLISTTEVIPNETPGISTTGEPAVVSSTGIPPVNNAVSGSGSTTLSVESTGDLATEQPATTSTSEIPNTEGPGASTTQGVNTEQPGATSTSETPNTQGPGVSTTEGVNTEGPGASTTQGVNTEQSGATSTSGAVNTEQPEATSTGEVNTEQPGATSTGEAVNTEEPGTSTPEAPIGTSTGIPPVNNAVSGSGTTTSSVESTSEAFTQPGAISTSEFVNTEEPAATTSSGGVVNTEGPGATSTLSPEETGAVTISESVSTEEPETTSTSGVGNTEEPVATTSSEGAVNTGEPSVTSTLSPEGTGATTTSEVVNTGEPGVSTSEASSGTSTGIPPVNNAVSGSSMTSGAVNTEEPATSTSGPEETEGPGVTTTSAGPEGTGGATSQAATSEEPGATTTSEGAVSTEAPGATTTSGGAVNTEEPGATTTSEGAVNTEAPGATTTSGGAVNTEEPGATTTSEGAVNTEAPGATTTSRGAVNTEEPGATTTSEGAVNTEAPGATTTSGGAVNTEEPGVTSSSESIEGTSTGIPPVNNAVSGSTLTSEVPESTSGAILTTDQEVTTTGPGFTDQPVTESITPVSTTEAPAISTGVEVTPGSSTSTSEGGEIGEATTGSPISTSEAGEVQGTITSASASSTEVVEVTPGSQTSTSDGGETQGTTTATLSTTQGTSPEESSSGIPPVNNAVSGTTLTTSTPVVPSSTTSSPASTSIVAPSYNYVCSGTPNLFNVVIDQPGKPKQWLSQLNFPDAGTSEGTWGYDTLPVVARRSQASRFSIGFGNSFQGTLQSNGAPITGAVRLTALGSPLQLFTAAHISDNMRVYTASVGSDCSLGLDIPNTGDNILAICSGVFTILTPAKQIQKGDACTQVRAFAVASNGPQSTSSTAIAPNTESSTRIQMPTSSEFMQTTIPSGTVGLVSSTSTFSPLTSSTTIAGCPVAPYFRILVNQTGMPPQYLWDPVSFGDDALSFTTDASKSLTFSLSPTTGQLQFNIVDFFGNPVLLASNQDVHNAGNEAIFFSTATKYQQLGYQPVVATINPDCSIGLTLPYNAANIIQACHGSIYLMLTPGKDCVTVSLLMLPYNPSATITSSIATTTSFLV